MCVTLELKATRHKRKTQANTRTQELLTDTAILAYQNFNGIPIQIQTSVAAVPVKRGSGLNN